MPREQRSRSRVVTIFWVLLFALVLLGALSITAAFLRREELKDFFDNWGSFASVLGLWLGFIAFCLTILTLLLTAQAEHEAARKAGEAAERAEQAVWEAQQRTVAMIERLGMQVLENGCDAVGRSVRRTQELVGEATVAQEEAEWRRLWKEVVRQCRECSESARDLLAIPYLNPNERASLSQQVSGLGQIASFIERNRLPATKNGKLIDVHASTLDNLFGLLTDVRHRIRRRVYEVSDASHQ